MEQTKITEHNRLEYYNNVYNVDFIQANLIDIGRFSDQLIIALDSCGLIYKNYFPTANIKIIEHVETAKQYQLARSDYDKLFNNTNAITVDKDGVLLLDHCPSIFKYKTQQELSDTLTTLTDTIDPRYCIVRLALITSGDNRLTDRFQNLSKIIPRKYSVVKFNYDQDYILIELKRKVAYATSIN